jgi:hypothetical protein
MLINLLCHVNRYSHPVLVLCSPVATGKQCFFLFHYLELPADATPPSRMHHSMLNSLCFLQWYPRGGVDLLPAAWCGNGR